VVHPRARVTEPFLSVNGEDVFIQNALQIPSIEKIKEFIGGASLFVIDEAQKVKDIGTRLKIMTDHIPGLRIIATGSSSFSLAHTAGEPLTGRKWTLRLLPLSQCEINSIEKPHETEARLETRLLFGSYPEVVLLPGEKEKTLYLRELVNSYLLKDILELDGIRRSDKIARLVQLVALQIGKEVSIAEIGSSLGMSKNTVGHYLDLLEKAFVLFQLGGFSRNLRKEITKSRKYYFYDNGVRNAVINNHNPLALRDDTGMLWENYIISERIKKQENELIISNNYFWRTYTGEEIDFVEEREGSLFAYEIKWSGGRDHPPKSWSAAYPKFSYEVIDRRNYLKFIC
jgi:hypothetical protein